MTDLPLPVRSGLRRLSRRIALGLFLDIWPRWAIGGLMVSGTAALLCRMFYPDAASLLPWLWLVPVLSALPAAYLCIRRRYQPNEIAALADAMSGGQGTLLTLLETKDASWADAGKLPQFAMPRWRPWRKLGLVFAAALFLAITLLLPQRVLTGPRSATLANDIVADLTTTLDELQQQELLTPEEEKKLEEEIERIRKDALDRMDASSWEAADAMREKLTTALNQKEDAMKWAEEALCPYEKMAPQIET
jgi:hypothetical protein